MSTADEDQGLVEITYRAAPWWAFPYPTTAMVLEQILAGHEHATPQFFRSNVDVKRYSSRLLGPDMQVRSLHQVSYAGPT